MKKVVWAILLILLILGSSSLLIFSGVAMQSGKNLFSQKADQQNESVNNDSGRISISENDSELESNPQEIIKEDQTIIASKLDLLKNKIGEYVEGQDYNHLIDGHGTGFRPPTKLEWDEIANNMYVIDQVSYQTVPPLNVDQSKKTWFPPIGNQGSQGSCVAWSIGYYIKTYQEAKEHNWDLSGARWISGFHGYPTQTYQNRIVSPAFIYNLQNGGEDNGLSFLNAINLIRSVGVCSWEKMPYTSADYTTWPVELAWAEAPLYRSGSGYQFMDLSTDQGLINLKNWLASEKLVTISVDGYKYSVLTSGDFWTLDNYANPNVNHANTIVGYDDSIAYIENGVQKFGAFKVANSWGVGGWEKVPDGFLWISYATMKQWIEYCVFYNDLINYEPTLTATFTINHAKRNECSILIGMGNPNTPLASKSFSQYINGGSLPFCSNSIILDITEFTNIEPNIYNQTYFLRVYDGGTTTTGTISSFSIEKTQSLDVPCQTIDKNYVYLDVFLPANDLLTLTDITVVSGGTYYTTPAILLIGGGGQGATATAHVSCGVIYSIIITNSGSGYTSPPTIAIMDPNPKAKNAEAIVNYIIP